MIKTFKLTLYMYVLIYSSCNFNQIVPLTHPTQVMSSLHYIIKIVIMKTLLGTLMLHHCAYKYFYDCAFIIAMFICINFCSQNTFSSTSIWYRSPNTIKIFYKNFHAYNYDTIVHQFSNCIVEILHVRFISH